METTHTLLEELRTKILGLLQVYKAMEVENKNLKHQLRDMSLKLETLELENKALNDQNQGIKTAINLSESEANQKAKAKINELVREIDRCFAILNQ